MNENKHTPDIKCYRINYNSKYWANVAAKVGNQCSSPVGAVFAVNALCDAYEDIAKQRDELLAAVEYLWNIIDDIDTYGDVAKSNDRLFRKLVERRQSDRWKTGITTDGYTLNYDAIASMKGEQ